MCCFCRASENKGHLVKIKSGLVKIKSVLTQFIELQLEEHKAKGSGGLESGFWRSWSKEGQAWGRGDSQLQATRALGWMEKRHQDQMNNSTSPSGISGRGALGKLSPPQGSADKQRSKWSCLQGEMLWSSCSRSYTLYTTTALWDRICCHKRARSGQPAVCVRSHHVLEPHWSLWEAHSWTINHGPSATIQEHSSVCRSTSTSLQKEGKICAVV